MVGQGQYQGKPWDLGTGGARPTRRATTPTRRARAAGPAYGAYQVSGAATRRSANGTGGAASDSSGSLEAPAAPRRRAVPEKHPGQAVTGSAYAVRRRGAPHPTAPGPWRTAVRPRRPVSSASSKSATYWRDARRGDAGHDTAGAAAVAPGA